MTSIDLRIKYKSETGFAPTYGRTSYPQNESCNYKGNLTHGYAEWLEGPYTLKKRLAFKRDTGLDATYLKTGLVRYTKEYKDWLEEKSLQVYTILEQL